MKVEKFYKPSATVMANELVSVKVEMSRDAYHLICGLIHPSSEINIDGVCAPMKTWTEIREAFPLVEFTACGDGSGTNYNGVYYEPQEED